MPLSPGPHPCDTEGCTNETYYYKEVFVPYSEGIPVGELRKALGIKGRMFLCPVHYPMKDPGKYTITVVNSSTYGVKEREF